MCDNKTQSPKRITNREDLVKKITSVAWSNRKAGRKVGMIQELIAQYNLTAEQEGEYDGCNK